MTLAKICVCGWVRKIQPSKKLSHWRRARTLHTATTEKIRCEYVHEEKKAAKITVNNGAALHETGSISYRPTSVYVVALSTR
jgi:hypothetical protein